MDEDYLDSLLDEVDLNEKVNTIDSTMDADSGVELDLSDLSDISLDEMDGLDDIDLSDLELDDIDFDDMDVTSLKVQESSKEEPEEDMNLDALVKEFSEDSVEEDTSSVEDNSMEDLFASVDVDDVFNDATEKMNEDVSLPDGLTLGEPETKAEPEPEKALTNADIDSMDLDDLFSALGIEDENASEKPEDSAYTAGEADLDALFSSASEMEMDDEFGDLSDIEDISEKSTKKGKKKKETKDKAEKKSLSEIIFGEPDEDDEEEERLLAERKEKKAEEKAKKAEEKEAKKAEKQEQLEIKKQQDGKKQQEKDAKKQAKRDALNAELEAEKDQKKVSNVTVIIVFAIFAALAGLVYFGSKEFNYSQVIKKAADYFDRQKYRMAYDEVSGVDVKPKDEELKEQIYTVMYVERLYESYENNKALNRPDMALDALLRGLQKYDEHYEEAVALNIVEDIDVCRAKIIAALASDYGLTESDAYEIIELEGQAYSAVLQRYAN